MTPDLKRLRDAAKDLEEVLEGIELELQDDPAWEQPSDTSYLSKEERADPHIAANARAMIETNKLIAWFAEDSEGYVGLWRGPSSRPLETAPVVRLDTEGQYSIEAATVPNYIAIAHDEEDFDEVRAALIEAGFQVTATVDDIYAFCDEFEDGPNDYRDALYAQYLETN